MDCKHEHGAHVTGLGAWVCGQCWRMLDSRPTTYGTNVNFGPGLIPGTPPQIIRWQAAIRKSAEGLTLDDFLRGMARRYMRKSNATLDQALRYALDFCREVGEFGDPAFGWSASDAVDLADEDLENWDHDGDRSNA